MEEKQLTYKQAIKLPKGGAVGMVKPHFQAQAADSISMACKKAGICRQFYYVTTTEDQRKEVKELRKKIVKQKLHW